MANRIRALLALTAFLWVWNVTSAQSYRIDANNDNSTIRFSIYFLGYGKIEGQFDRLQGKLELNERNLSRSKVQIEIDTTSINSNYRARDAYLRGPAFLATSRFPKAFFKSSRFKIVDRRTISIEGNLTLRGITRTITVVSKLDRSAGLRTNRRFRGATSFHLSDFGIKGLPSLLATKLFLTMHIDGSADLAQ